jgi:hypothetical protein
MTSSTALKLPARRLEQLKTLAAVLGLSTVDTISHMIRKEVAAGTIPATLPGIEVKRAGDVVRVKIDNAADQSMSLDAALSLAGALREVADRASSGYMSPDFNYLVMRRGAGINVALPLKGETTSFTNDLARDFAALIEDAAT